VRGEALAAEIVTAMSAWLGSVIEVFAVAELLVLLGSAAVPVAEATSEMTVPAVTPLFAVTTKLMVALLPEARPAAAVQVNVPPDGAAHIQPPPLAETYVAFAGTVSFTVMDPDAAGPLFVTFWVYVMLLPAGTVVTEGVFVMARSASVLMATVLVAVAELFVLTGSVVVVETLAVSEIVVPRAVPVLTLVV
jgi:hypothetical protein